GAGQAILIAHNRLSDASLAEGSRTYTIRVERDLLRHRAPSLDKCFLHTTRAGDPSFALLRAYCAQLMTLAGDLPAPAARLADTQIQELGASSVSGPPAEDGVGPLTRAARLHAIKTGIAEKLPCADLSIVAVASQHRLSVRYVQGLFEEEGLTF